MTYITEATSWKAVAAHKWVIFDADAIISIVAFSQEYIFDELKSLDVSFVYIHPVLLELMNTNSPTEKLRRSKLLVDYDFVEIPLTASELKHASEIQKSLPIKSTPSPTDLYLGAALARHHEEDRFLLTANIKDFPLPLYTRKGYMLLQNTTGVKLLTLLCLDKEMLVQTKP